MSKEINIVCSEWGSKKGTW